MRAGTVVALTIPLTLALVFALMDIAQIDLHRISLGALIIALALLVDDAMTSIDAMTRRLAIGEPKEQAATYAYKTLAFAMLTGTLVTIAGFVPAAERVHPCHRVGRRGARRPVGLRPGPGPLEHLCRSGRDPLLPAAQRAAAEPLLCPGGAGGEGLRRAPAHPRAAGEGPAGDFEFGQELPLIWRRDRVPTLTVQADVAPGVLPETVVGELAAPIAALAQGLSAGYRIDLGGTVEESAASRASVIAVVPLMLFLMLTLLMFQLRSFPLLLMVLSVVPLGLIGVVGALLVSGRPLGFVAILGILGILALIGMIAKNSVILISQIEQERATGRPIWDAVLDASVTNTISAPAGAGRSSPRRVAARSP